MNDSRKPFACTIEGCQMTFTNEDHLNLHHKKHDMVLNLGLANKNLEVADQTPTPTRFIRNCEEVGLFQDLQNVNPFDETFKKAMEAAKSGSLHVLEVPTNDDTLHTPHIFPHVVGSNINNERRDSHSSSSDFCISSVPSIQESQEDSDNYELVIAKNEIEEAREKHINLKNKLKETIKNKGKPSNDTSPVKRPNGHEKITIKKNKSDESVSDCKAKIREMNRAAQLRCRKRKQIKWRKMEEEIKFLKSENYKLSQENQNFKNKLYALKELLVKNGSIKSNKDIPFLGQMEEILNSSGSPPKQGFTPIVLQTSNQQKTVIPLKNKIPISSSSLIPVSAIQNSGQSMQKPVLIQVMGSVSQLAVSVVPNK